jgi:type II secretory pathway pseudopilin PulG
MKIMERRSHSLLKILLQILQQLRWRGAWQGRQVGLTIIEILVAAIIAVIMVTILLGFMVQLLNTNRREQVLTETQQEMQAALNYISNDVQSAIYVYDGECLDGDDNGVDSDDGCAGIFDSSNNYLNNAPGDSVPILAFWKLEPLPSSLATNCSDNDDANNTIQNDITDVDNATVPIPCASGKTPTLVVYFLRRNDRNNEDWQGLGRIIRYELGRYNSSGDPVAGYADPSDPRTNYRQWPEDNGGNDLTNTSGTGNANSEVLTDFVDTRSLDAITGETDAAANCPTGYQITPSDSTLKGYTDYDSNTYVDMRNFHACVSSGDASSGATQKRVSLFLRGNSYGKEGVESPSDGSLQTLSTEVLSRGVTNKIPR